MRVTSALWVSAYLRRTSAAGAFPVIEYKGADEAGAIFIRVDSARDAAKLYMPAPMTAYGNDVSERKFELYDTGADLSPADISDKLRREREIDPDIWIVAVDDREARHFLDEWLVIFPSPLGGG